MITEKDYGYPHIPLSELKELAKVAKRSEKHWNWYSTWLFLVRQKADSLVISDLQSKIRDAKKYRGGESYPCPLCEYRNGIWVQNCGMHQQIADLIEELEKARAIIRSYEENDE